MKKIAVYAFSGDPVTYGHLDLIKRAQNLFDRVIVAIGTNPDKNYLFSLPERATLAKLATKNLPKVVVKSFTGLLVDFAYEQKADVIIKGVRHSADFHYEQTLSHVGLSQDQGIETILLLARPSLAHISSSTVKALQKEHGFTHDYVPLAVKVALEKKLSKQVLIGLTGEIASGKTYLAEQLTKIAEAQGIEVHNIELDQLAHQIQDQLTEPRYRQVRLKIFKAFGSEVKTKAQTVNRKKLGELVFNNPVKMKKLNEIMWKPVLVRLRKELAGKSGLILLNSALIAEADLLSVCNNRVILTTVSKKTQQVRLKQRKLSAPQIKHRLNSQFSTLEKKAKITARIKNNSFGKLWEVTEKTDLVKFSQQLRAEIL